MAKSNYEKEVSGRSDVVLAVHSVRMVSRELRQVWSGLLCTKLRTLILTASVRHSGTAPACLFVSATLATHNDISNTQDHRRSRAQAVTPDCVQCDAEEFKQRVVAEEYTTAHQVFVTTLGPAWFHDRKWQQIHEAVQLLQPHAGAVGRDNGSVGFAAGAGLYASYLTLKVCPER